MNKLTTIALTLLTLSLAACGGPSAPAPVSTDAPSQPGQPSQPNQPSQPGQPSQPSQPSRPGQPSAQQDTNAPAVVKRTPAPGEQNAPLQGALTVVFDEPVQAESVQVEFDAPFQVQWNAARTVLLVLPDAPLTEQTNYRLRLAAGVRDDLGNATAEMQEWTFRTGDFTAPAVVSVVPADDTENVPLGAPVVVTFSEPVQPQSVTAKVSASGGPFNGKMAWSDDARVLTFLPENGQWSSDSDYDVYIKAGVKDLAGNATPQDFGSDFSSADKTPPGAPNSTPHHGAVNVPVHQVVKVYFDELIDTSSVKFMLTGGQPVTGTATWKATEYQSILTFQPSAPLAKNTVHTISVQPGVKDVHGNVNGKLYTSSFTTAK